MTVSERLNEIAMRLAGYDEVDDLPEQLAQLANELEDIERLMPPDDGFPNVAQSLALGRVIQCRWPKMQAGGQHISAGEIAFDVTVSRAPFGLPESYIGFLFRDGYEGGIDREGQVST